jgi:flavin reductase (DIM6/NTAB) family NADH-FMN oxidoreductase RutF
MHSLLTCGCADQRRNAPKRCLRYYSTAINHGTGTDAQSPSSNVVTSLKSIMRCMPQPIVVVTSRDNVRNRADYGMTISTFTTVCIQPESCISFSIKRPSHTLDAIESSGSFAVHFLRDSSTAARLAHSFSINPGPFFAGEDTALIQDFGVERSESSDQLPLIYEKGSNGDDSKGGSIYSRMTCRYLPNKSVSVGDHTVLFAEPVTLTTYDTGARGLSYSHGGYILDSETSTPSAGSASGGA